MILFALQGHAITTRPLDVARIALPLLAYFAVMWTGSLALGRAVRLPYPRAVTLAFTAAGNNFELAIAVAIATWSSPWAAGTPAPSSRASAIWTGTCPTPPGCPSKRFAPSATTSPAASSNSSASLPDAALGTLSGGSVAVEGASVGCGGGGGAVGVAG